MTGAVDMGRVAYQGLPEHGKTLPVIGRREFLGMPMVILDNDGYRLCLPADRVVIITQREMAA